MELKEVTSRDGSMYGLPACLWQNWAPLSLPSCTGRPHRLSHRKWRETKQQLILWPDQMAWLLLTFSQFPVRHPISSRQVGYRFALSTGTVGYPVYLPLPFHFTPKSGIKVTFPGKSHWWIILNFSTDFARVELSKVWSNWPKYPV